MVPSSFGHPQLRAILGAEALSATGDAVCWVGLLVWRLSRPDGTGLIALAAVARLAPRVVFGPAGGVIADQCDRPVLLVALDLVQAALMVGLAVMVDANNSAVQIHGAEFLAAINESAVPPTALLEGISARLAELDQVSRAHG
jgi:hypothetical protein